MEFSFYFVNRREKWKKISWVKKIENIRGGKGSLARVLGGDDVWNRPIWWKIDNHIKIYQKSILRRKNNECKFLEMETSILCIRKRKVTHQCATLFSIRGKMLEDESIDLRMTCRFGFWSNCGGSPGRLWWGEKHNLILAYRWCLWLLCDITM